MLECSERMIGTGVNSLRKHWLTTVAMLLVCSPSYAGSFEDVLSSTYVNNPRIKAERQRLESTDEEVSQATSGFRPTLNANYNKGRQKSTFDGGNPAYSDSETKQLQVSQPLFRGGGTFSSYRAAKQRVTAGQFQLAGVEQEVLFQAASTYMDVLANSAILQLARENQNVLQQQLDSANERFKVGEVTRTDVAQSQSRLAAAQASVISAEGELLNSMAQFERVVGYRPAGVLTVPEKLPSLPSSLKEALDIGRATNPQLLTAIHSAKAASYDVRTTEARLLPSVSLVGNMSRQDGAGVSGQDRFNQDSLTVQFQIPLYQAGADWSRVREASATARQRDQESMDRRLDTDRIVTENWDNLETAVSTIGTRDAQIKAAEAALEGVKQEQQYGSRTVLDVLDAQQELFGARTNLVRAQRDRIVAAYNLVLSLGQMSPNNLELSAETYDPESHAKSVEWQWLGY